MRALLAQTRLAGRCETRAAISVGSATCIFPRYGFNFLRVPTNKMRWLFLVEPISGYYFCFRSLRFEKTSSAIRASSDT